MFEIGDRVQFYREYGFFGEGLYTGFITKSWVKFGSHFHHVHLDNPLFYKGIPISNLTVRESNLTKLGNAPLSCYQRKLPIL